MVFPDMIRDTITMMRRRLLEIDGLIERIERERTSLHQIRKKDSVPLRQPYGRRRRSGT
jgi:hypothetical protein